MTNQKPAGRLTQQICAATNEKHKAVDLHHVSEYGGPSYSVCSKCAHVWFGGDFPVRNYLKLAWVESRTQPTEAERHRIIENQQRLYGRVEAKQLTLLKGVQ